jgi:lycopene beta-cyclase
LFKASLPSKRHLVLQRFYTLSESLIKRFYEGNLHKKDKFRILIGKPPVPVLKALYFFSEKAFLAREKKRVKND